MSCVRRLARDRRAVTALEYGLIASMVAVLIVLAITSLDINIDKIGTVFHGMASKL